MEPKISNGSFFIASGIPYKFGKPKIGDIILFKDSGETIVKKIVKIEKGKYTISGENKFDSKKFNSITKKDILGKIIFNF